MSTRPSRERKPSSKIAFIEDAGAKWEAEKERKAAAPKRKRATSKKTAAKTSKGTGKKSVKKKDNGGVKRPLSAFFIFSKETRDEVKQEYPNATFAEVGKILGEWWGDCTPEEKAVYIKKSQRDRLRYENQLAGIADNGKGAAPRNSVAARPRSASGGKPSYTDMAIAAIAALKDRKGSSSQAIEKWILDAYPKLDFKRHFLRKGLKTAETKNLVTRIKNSYKIKK